MAALPAKRRAIALPNCDFIIGSIILSLIVGAIMAGTRR